MPTRSALSRLAAALAFAALPALAQPATRANPEADAIQRQVTQQGAIIVSVPLTLSFNRCPVLEIHQSWVIAWTASGNYSLPSLTLDCKTQRGVNAEIRFSKIYICLDAITQYAQARGKANYRTLHERLPEEKLRLRCEIPQLPTPLPPITPNPFPEPPQSKLWEPTTPRARTTAIAARSIRRGWGAG
jgi:hypothetical protein